GFLLLELAKSAFWQVIGMAPKKLIWRHSGRAVHGLLGSLSEDYSDRLLGQISCQPGGFQ
ncbi:MAG: hypothetical protein V1797_17080, partial [Pseudomonadota bacterium]